MIYSSEPKGCRFNQPPLFLNVYKNSAKLFYAINIFRWQIITSSIDTYTICQIFSPAVLSTFPFAIPLSSLPLKGHKTQNSNIKKRSIVGFGPPHYTFCMIFIYLYSFLNKANFFLWWKKYRKCRLCTFSTK